MDLRKLLSVEHHFSALCSKGRVFSGFGAGLLASLLVVSLLFSVGGNGGAARGATAPSLLSRFFWAPEVAQGGTLSGIGGGVSGLTGAVERSHGAATAAAAAAVHAEGIQEGKFSGDDTVERSAGMQGESLDSSCDGGLVGIGNGSFAASKSEANRKPHEKDITGNLTCTSGTANLSVREVNVSLSAAGRMEQRVNKTDLPDGRRNASAGGGQAQESHGATGALGGSGSRRRKGGPLAKCDIFNGRWVRDENKPYYPPGSCPHIDMDFNCHDNGRPDHDFLKWRWQPNDCDIPSLNATDFLERLRGQRLIFVGDSLNRNMWESLVCILRHGVKNKNNVYEMSGRNQFKTHGYYSFIFKDYNCSIDFVRSPFLVREQYANGVNQSDDEKLRLDVMDATTSAYRKADIVVFNTGHWWTHEKTSRGINYYQEGELVYPVLKVMDAYKKALSTWARWVENNINPSKTQVIFRGYSLPHFRGGQWNSGGQCHKETEPIFNQSFVRKYPAKMRALEQVLKQMKTPVIYLNISRLTDYRKDGHPSIYRRKYKSVEEKINAEKSQDCSHWCLPGIPDTWNELLYTSLLMVGRGSWRN